MRFPFFRNRDSVKNGILISIRRTGDGFHPGLFSHGFIDHNGFNVGDDFLENFLIVHGTGLLSEKEKLMVKSIVSQTKRNENNKCAKKCTKKYSVCNELLC